jgi:hypothetical protein
MSKFYEKINFSVSKTSMSREDYPRCKYIIVVVHMVRRERKIFNPYSSEWEQRNILGHKIQLIEKSSLFGEEGYRNFSSNPLKRQCRKKLFVTRKKRNYFPLK